MEQIITTDSAMHSTSDIAGVKDVPTVDPENGSGDVSRVADVTKNTEIGAAGELEAVNGEGNDPLEAEFDELIRGRFCEVYKKRTESIIRKRLRSGKTRTESQSVSSVKENGAQSAAPLNEEKKHIDAADGTDGYERARQLNKNRPIENGIGCGSAVVTKINVAALDGQSVLSIIKRVGSGEKISFK